MKAGSQGPSLRSKVSVWLGAPVRKMKMTFFALPMGVAAACATDSPGREPGSRKYPLMAVAMWRKNMRRPMCGRLQKRVPRTLLGSCPNRSFIARSFLVTEHEIEFVDHGPRQIFKRGVLLRGSGGFT